jgi:glyoxylase-like metal-dependent hydrolase (beta-lactamase superfamily II)
MAETIPGTPELYTARSGARVYRLPLRLFPGLNGFAHLVLDGGLQILVDSGSGYGDSNDDLEAGLAAVRSHFGEDVGWESLTHVLLTHGHIDHFGGLPYVRRRTRAPFGVHELDRPTVSFHNERLAVVAHRLRRFLTEAGVEAERLEHLMELYLVSKHLYTSQAVDFTYEACGMKVGALELIHVPGHCPGQVVMRLGDVLLSGDHVLPETSPHQSPEALTLSTGLGHYMDSIQRLKPLAPAIRVTLGGHEGPMTDLAARLRSIEAFHRERLALVERLLEAPLTMAELSDRLFPAASGYHALLAFEETGAHVEYLVQRGFVGLANADALENDLPEPTLYVRRGPHVPPTEVGRSTVGDGSSRESALGGIRGERADVQL